MVDGRQRRRPAEASQVIDTLLSSGTDSGGPEVSIARAEMRGLVCRRTPDEAVPLSQLRDLGVLYWRLDADAHESDPKLQAIREVRGYSYQVQQLFDMLSPQQRVVPLMRSAFGICWV